MVTEDPDAQCTKKTGFNRVRQKESRQAEVIYQVIRYA